MKLLVVGFFAVVAPAVAHAQAGSDRVLVYVDDVSVADPKLQSEANALTSSVCSTLGKDKRLDVMCAPDVKQIIGFAAASSMIGTTSPAVENLQKRLDAVAFVVAGNLQPRGADMVLTLQVGPKSAQSDSSALFAETSLVKLEAVGPPKATKLLDKLPDIGARLVKAMLSPTPSDAPAPPPPAPLPTTPTTKK